MRPEPAKSRRHACQLRQQRPLARSQRPSVRGAATRRDRPARVGRGCPPLVARPRTGCPEGPLEVDPSRRARGRAGAAGPPADPRAAGRVRSGRGPVPQRVEQRARRLVVAGRATVERRRHQVEALQEARRKHRPDDERRRGEVVAGDDAGEGEGERREERTVRPDARRERLGRRARRAGSHRPRTIPSARRRPHSTRTASPGTTSARASGRHTSRRGHPRDRRVDGHLDVAQAGSPDGASGEAAAGP